MASTFTGTPTYMSPERISGQEYSYPIDIWSFGVCLATIALGKYPFPTSSGYWGVVQAIQDSPPPQVRGFSPSMQDFLNACLLKDPRERPSASQLLQHGKRDPVQSPPQQYIPILTRLASLAAYRLRRQIR